jgi:hypothetical protein
MLSRNGNPQIISKDTISKFLKRLLVTSVLEDLQNIYCANMNLSTVTQEGM